MLRNFVETKCANSAEIYCERVEDFKRLGEGGVNKEKKCFNYSLSALVCPTLRPTWRPRKKTAPIVIYRATIIEELQ